MSDLAVMWLVLAGVVAMVGVLFWRVGGGNPDDGTD